MYKLCRRANIFLGIFRLFYHVYYYLDNQISYFNITLTVNSLTENILLLITGKCRIPALIIGLPLLITITLY